MIKIIKILSLSTLFLSSTIAYAGPLVQEFKNPSFSGFGWSHHVQSIRAMEEAAKQANENQIAAEVAAERAAAANTPLARFVSLFTSQVYSQLATQLSNNLFAEGASNAGSFVLDGSTISYVKSDGNVTLTVVDINGNTTVITVPIATFAF
jgi:hypothetical protein